MKDIKDIEYIAGKYRPGLFAVEPALRRIKPVVRKRWTPAHVAAAAAAAVVLSVTAAVVIHESRIPESPAQETKTMTAPAADGHTVKVIDFEETPLPVVIESIREVYGVDVTGMPANADDYTLSLHYEGTAADLIETINEILGTEMTVRK